MILDLNEFNQLSNKVYSQPYVGNDSHAKLHRSKLC